MKAKKQVEEYGKILQNKFNAWHPNTTLTIYTSVLTSYLPLADTFTQQAYQAMLTFREIPA